MENLIDKAIPEWKNSDVPLVIWGGQKLLGGKAARWFDSQNIKYDAIAVNKRFAAKDDTQSVILEDYLKDHVCSLIVAFKGYEPYMLDALKKENIKKVYAFDFQGRFPVDWDSVITSDFLKAHDREYCQLKSHLADQMSQAALDTFIHQKMYSEYTKEYSLQRQYFEEGIFSFHEKECFVDCGGFDGADTKKFFDCVKNDSNAESYIFEPDPMNYNFIKDQFAQDGRVHIFNYGTSDESGQLHFKSAKGASSSFSNSGEIVVDVNRLDDVIGNINVTFLKMDVEGFELKTLHGAEKIIKRCRPKMAVCVYHRAEDLFTIPQYLLSLHNDYRFYIRSYHPAAIETVLYAV